MNIKLIIWDLDDTLWRGTLDEGDDVQLIESRAKKIHEFNNCGIVSAICSKNDLAMATEKLKEMNLWDQFVFPRIAFVPKGDAVRQLIEDMHLRPMNVLFMDDNPLNLNEVMALLPDINIANAASPECDILLNQIYENNKHVTKSRLSEYRSLQERVSDRTTQPTNNEEFLKSCGIHIALPNFMDNLEFSQRIEELVNRANQLNYTSSRFEPDTASSLIIDVVHYETWSVFAWDKYGYHGLVGFAAIDRATAKVLHFVFSCRIMHMGIEANVLKIIQEKFPTPDITGFVQPLPSILPTWVTTEAFSNETIRSFVRDHEKPNRRTEIKIRIMMDCLSGGVAHFSRWRDTIEFDNYPRHFSMQLLLNDRHLEQHYPPFLVYAGTVDHTTPRWMEAGPDLEKGLYKNMVIKFCTFVEERNYKLLVTLPNENAPEEMYRPHFEQTRERTVAFNSIWREQAKSFPSISTLELSDIIMAKDMTNISHYYADAVKRIAESVDKWYEAETMLKA